MRGVRIAGIKMKTRTTLRILAVLLLTAFAGLSAQSKQHPSPCKADREKLCKSAKPGQGRVWVCLKSHEDELSSECKTHMSTLREKGKEFTQACKADIKANCKDVKAGGGRVLQCLKEHKDKVSPGCKAKFDSPPKGEE